MALDNMRIQSTFMTRIVSKVISKFMKKKFGVEVNVRLRNLQVYKHDDGKNLTFELDLGGDIDEKNLALLVAKMKED